MKDSLANLTKRMAVLALITTITIAAVSGCSKNGGSYGSPDGGTPSEPPVTTEPSDNDVIQAVRDHVRGKTYTKVSTEWRTEWRECTTEHDWQFHQVQCQSYNGRYPEQVPSQETQTFNCEELPGSESGMWLVQKKDEDTWRVVYQKGLGSYWTVKKLDGASANLKDAVRGSGFTFAIEAEQEC